MTASTARATSETSRGAAPTSWTDDEPPLDFRAELRYLARRGAARPLGALGASLLCALAVMAAAGRTPRSFESTIVLSATEGGLDGNPAPPPSTLREHVEDVSLSSARLLEVIRRRGLYRRELALGPERAVEAFRDDLRIEVWRNYFLEERESQDDSARSARLSIAYAAPDPQLAFEVAGELGRLVVDVEEVGRTEVVREEVALLEGAVAARRAELIERRDALRGLQLRAAGEAAPDRRLRVAPARIAVEEAAYALDGLEQRRKAVELRARFEARRMGLVFEVVDGGRPAAVGAPRPLRLALLGAAIFLLALPITGVTLAAFDPRIYDLDDVRRCGFVPLGRVSVAGLAAARAARGA